MKAKHAILLLSLLSINTACRSYINVQNKAIPVRTSLNAKGGGRICLVGDRHLLLRPNPENTLATWGFELIDSKAGPRVAFVVSRNTRMRESDLILRARTLKILNRVANPKEIELSNDKSRIRVMKKLGTRPSSKAELIAYGSAWCLLELLIQRGEKEVVVTQEIGRPREIPIRLFDFSENARSGVFLTRIDHWKRDWQPAHAKPGDLLVFYVGQNTLLGKAGVRPLDLIRPANGSNDWSSLLMGSRVKANGAVVQYPEKELKELSRTVKGENLKFRGIDDQVEIRRFQLFSGTFEYETNGLRTHGGIGPFDWIFHFNSDYWYDERTDTYGYVQRYSIGSVIQSISSKRGATESSSLFGVDLIVDSAKYGYYQDGLED